MKIKLIASDLDGTLLTDDKRILDSTREVLCRAAEQGIHFVPATGRPLGSVPEDVMKLPGVEYVITSNGAAIHSVKTGKRIYERLLGAESVEKLLELQIEEMTEDEDLANKGKSVEGRPESTAALPIAYEAFVNGIPYASTNYVENPFPYGVNEHGAAYIRKSRRKIDDMRSFIREHRDRLDSVAVVCGDPVKKAEISALIREKVPGVFVTSSVSQLIEIGHQDAGKGQTLCFLLNLLGISAEEAMCFGDADNDIDMLQAVRYGIAMENGSDTCKQAAYAVTGSNQEDGVGQMIRTRLK